MKCFIVANDYKYNYKLHASKHTIHILDYLTITPTYNPDIISIHVAYMFNGGSG